MTSPLTIETSLSPNSVPGSIESYVVGKSEDEAQLHVLNAGYRFRVVCVDGEHLFVSQDGDYRRVNAEIVNGLVTRVFLG
jgi:hypothetical protein